MRIQVGGPVQTPRSGDLSIDLAANQKLGRVAVICFQAAVAEQVTATRPRHAQRRGLSRGHRYAVYPSHRVVEFREMLKLQAPTDTLCVAIRC